MASWSEYTKHDFIVKPMPEGTPTDLYQATTVLVGRGPIYAITHTSK